MHTKRQHTFRSCMRSVTYTFLCTLVRCALRLVVLQAENGLLHNLQSASVKPLTPMYLGVKYAQTSLFTFLYIFLGRCEDDAQETSLESIGRWSNDDKSPDRTFVSYKTNTMNIKRQRIKQ